MSSNRRRLPEAAVIPAFNPLDYANLTKNVVDELMRQRPVSLPLSHRFAGAGVYALFYMGDDSDYAVERSPHATQPIYVGKAMPPGGRKGIIEAGSPIGTSLYSRLMQHAASINAAIDLETTDFSVRYLVVEPLWIVMAEIFLITNFKPLWNLQLDGFGNHNPGVKRLEGEIPWWDARHPGRPWAAAFQQQTRSQEQARERIREYHRLQEVDPAALERLAEKAAEEEAERE